MDKQKTWRAAAGHANQEIGSQGTWTCPCSDCVYVRANIIVGASLGHCMNCQQPTGSRTKKYCSPACKQQSYRVRRATQTYEGGRDVQKV